MADQHSNFAVSTVATAPSPATSGTSLTVASGQGSRFPAVPFNATVRPINAPPDPSNAEIIRVTARSTDTFSTIARAQEGSTARAIQAGDHISATVTSKSLTDIEAVFGAYSHLADNKFSIGSAAAAGTYLFNNGGYTMVLAAAASSYAAFYLDPADYAVTGMTVKVRVRGMIVTDSVAPGITFTYHLYPVATWGGGSNVRPTVATVGASVTNVAIATPAAGGPSQATSADATLSAGWYVLAVVTSGANATNAACELTARVEMRRV